MLKTIRFNRCSTKRRSDQNNPDRKLSSEEIFSAIIRQQYKLREIIALSRDLDINRKIIPIQLFGLIRMSIAETLDYLFHYQANYFNTARHLLLLQ